MRLVSGARAMASEPRYNLALAMAHREGRALPGGRLMGSSSPVEEKRQGEGAFEPGDGPSRRRRAGAGGESPPGR